MLVSTVTRPSKVEKSDKNRSKVLEDWHEKDDHDGDDEAESISTVEKDDKDDKDTRTEDEEEPKLADADKRSKVVEKPVVDSAASNKNGRSTSTKSDIKNLINSDWGDDEDDDAF